LKKSIFVLFFCAQKVFSLPVLEVGGQRFRYSLALANHDIWKNKTWKYCSYNNNLLLFINNI